MRCAKFSHLEIRCAKFSHLVSHGGKVAWGVRKWHSCAKRGFRTVRKFSHLAQWCAKLVFREFAPWNHFSHLEINFAPWFWGVRKWLPLDRGFRTLVLGCAKFSHLEIRCSVSLVLLPCLAFEEFSPSFMIFFWNLSSKLTWIKTK